MKRPDLTREEQDHVRAALRLLRVQAGTWVAVCQAVGANERSLQRVMAGRLNVSASLAVRTARLAGVGVDALLAGEYPPEGVCPHCGHSTNPGP